jgi:hypothetical protein
MVFLLLGLGGSGMPNDLLSLIDPEAYFRARQVPVTVAKMLDLAGKQPAGAKDEVAHLLAIRMLGEDPDQVQKEKEDIVKVLEAITTGKQGEGGHGFARAYARRTLERLGVKVAPSGKEGAEPKLIDALGWFPDKVTFVAAGRQAAGAAAEGKDNPLRDFLKANVPAREMEEVYKFAEAVGNVRIDTFALGYAPDPKQQRKGRIYLRITGAANHQRLGEFLRKSIGNGAAREEKGPKGEPITLFSPPGAFGPAFALVGDTDFLIAGYEDNQANHAEVIEQILKIRAGTQPDALKGPLAGELKKISAEAIGLVLGDLPQEVRQGLMIGGPFQSFPDRMQVEIKPGAKGSVDIHFQGKFGNANAAKAFADSVATLRKQGIEALKNPPPLPPGAKIPPRVFELMRTALEGLKMDPKGDAVTGGMQISRELINLVPAMLGGYMTIRSTEVPMPQAVPKAIPAPGK